MKILYCMKYVWILVLFQTNADNSVSGLSTKAVAYQQDISWFTCKSQQHFKCWSPQIKDVYHKCKQVCFPFYGKYQIKFEMKFFLNIQILLLFEIYCFEFLFYQRCNNHTSTKAWRCSILLQFVNTNRKSYIVSGHWHIVTFNRLVHWG